MNTPVVQVSIVLKSDLLAIGLEQSLKSKESHLLNIARHSPPQAIKSIKEGKTDVLILDAQLGRSIAHALPDKPHEPKILLISERQQAGAELPIERRHLCGLMPLQASEEQLMESLDVMIDCDSASICPDACRRCALSKTLSPSPPDLTTRELQIFEYLGQLLSTREITEQLNISPKTVESHCANIKRKLNLSDSRELLQAAIDWKRGDWEDPDNPKEG
ncbi:response regulator transcription factor [Wenzhouxiangella marina]|uniref:Uncharacterized protein n=1 Tax=Wenzhouxiangella marina TaxID=1579979 RepID=A0A0K0XY38_9GAMM|nr:LuxR C-terminal-related transcriptional regulator [Wenzhouxiangella marina]AKS42609.1 hypothetical protein WM2015_2246 [Wenzhouxiangella marina]MBB6085609.1 DNA-binding NarL/FixJ family response regulator [Wenzhouxiangella marina]